MSSSSGRKTGINGCESEGGPPNLLLQRRECFSKLFDAVRMEGSQAATPLLLPNPPNSKLIGPFVVRWWRNYEPDIVIPYN